MLVRRERYIFLLSTWRVYLIYKQNIVLLILDKKEK